ncbi:Barstar-like nuclease inhibitor [Deinococcus geothermalis DSM 11300]|uniref:Barstar-like nuclease inhibitor n=1 Tax=Deinococcus geothermalis (strain DSM 11300 / CIP 105573 / AG-3a) TaxID=319795 RepID=Q1IZH9_DEIGD|nr:barstar family protein [Deinococcus geothermalis]ABF45355.1 Barstar-like nuclease inhibitor [Deinococcus geothermalis DSM 11300]
MINVFNEAPQGIQPAPHDPRIVAAGYQVAVREVDFSHVRDKESLMMAFLRGLALTESFGRNWDALYDVLTDPDARPARFALVLCDYEHFRKHHKHLAAELERVLLDAQRDAATRGRFLWLLAEEPASDPRHW